MKAESSNADPAEVKKAEEAVGMAKSKEASV